jgi:hypothetical protein
MTRPYVFMVTEILRVAENVHHCPRGAFPLPRHDLVP